MQQKVVDLGAMGWLVPMLDNEDEMVVKLASMIVANMASEEKHRRFLGDLAVVYPLTRLLGSSDEEVCNDSFGD